MVNKLLYTKALSIAKKKIRLSDFQTFRLSDFQSQILQSVRRPKGSDFTLSVQVRVDTVGRTAVSPPPEGKAILGQHLNLNLTCKLDLNSEPITALSALLMSHVTL